MPDRSFVRRPWIPVLILGLGALTLVGLWSWSNPEFPIDKRTGYSILTIMISLSLLAIWLLFLSGLRWFVRLGVLLAVIGLVVGTVRSVEFQGNLIPVLVHFRWERLHAFTRVVERANQQLAAPTPIPTPTPADYPDYRNRNRNRNGVITGLTLARDWSASPPRPLWRQSSGGGYAGFVVVGPAAVTVEQIDDKEAVVCYDADTGRERWSYAYPALFKDPAGRDGPRATPTIADGDVYSLGATGKLVRLDGATGQLKWDVDILAGNENITWAISGSPLVYDRFVVVNPGAQVESAKGRAVVAYDRDTGKVHWSAGDRKAGYSSPQLATIAGVRQVLVFDGEVLGAYDPDTGKELWHHEWKTQNDVNVAQPIVLDGDRVFISSGYGHGCALLKVTLADGKWSVAELWTNDKFRCKFTSPVYHDGHFYGLDEAVGGLTCLDAKDGQIKWKEGRYGNGQVLLVGDVVVVGAENGRLVLVEATPAAHRELASFRALSGPKNWNHLVIARGRAYVRNHFQMACYELPVEK